MGLLKVNFIETSNALQHKAEILKRLHNKTPVIFLDYDGTLTPIVEDPEKAILSSEMKNLLRRLAAQYPVAIISGRDLDDVKKMIQVDNLVYAGSHGFDIVKPGGKVRQNEEGQNYLPFLDRAGNYLHTRLDVIPGINIERKKFAIAVHYRNVEIKYIDQIKKTTDEVLEMFPDLKKGEGKKIIELQPNIEWHKGKAVRWLLQSQPRTTREPVPVYIGDDLTDENAFDTLAGDGLTVLVGDHGRKTSAHYRLENVNQVKQFLNFLLEIEDS